MAERPAVGAVTHFELKGNTAQISARPAKARLVFLTDDMVRIQVAQNGRFTDDAAMVVRPDDPGVKPQATDAGAYHRLTTAALTLRVYKDPLRFGL